jgi:phage gp36-like protein
MGYCTREMLEAKIGTEGLRQIASLPGEHEVSDSAVVDAIEAASSLIDSYAGKQYAVPIAEPAPDVIVRLAMRLAIHALTEDRRMLTPEDTAAQGDRIRWLEQLAEGKVNLGVDPLPANHSTIIDRAVARPSPKVVSRLRFRGWS